MDLISQGSLEDIGKIIIRPEYHASLKIWLSNAPKSEIKGLKLAHLVVLRQGLKRFKPHKKHDIGMVAISAKKLYNPQSQYNDAYSENVLKRVFESEVLKFVKLSSMPISKTLKAESLMFLERWLALGDEEYYQSLLLSFLRAFYSVINVNFTSPTSTSHETFSKKPIEKIAIYGRKKFYNEEPRVKLPEIISHCKSQEVLVSKNTLIRDVKEIVNRDHKDLIKWVPGINTFKTMYQDNFYTKTVQNFSPPRKDFYTSTSIKLMPDRLG